MSNRKLFVKVKKKETQRFIDLLKKHSPERSLIDERFKVFHESNHTFIPLIEDITFENKFLKNIKEEVDFTLELKNAKLNEKYRPKSFQEYLKGTFPKKFSYIIPKSYDTIGEIAIIEFDRNIDKKNIKIEKLKHSIAQSLIEFNKKIKTVYEKKSEIKGDYRLRDLAFLNGNNNSITIHKENNCVFKVDVKTTYFSPRLLYERRRVTNSNIKKGEVVVDLFAGIGPFSIQIAKKHGVNIYSFDINPNAIKYLKINIGLNNLTGEIFPYILDVKKLTLLSSKLGKKLMHKTDRVIMNLPEKALEFLYIACYLLKPSGGIIHFYQISEKPFPIKRTLSKLKERLNQLNWTVEKIIAKKKVKSYSPKADIVVVDFLVRNIYLS